MGNGRGYEGVVEFASKNDRPAPKHGEKFDQALQNAVDGIPADDPNEWFEVRYLVRVRHSSPGWVDGYSVRLAPPGG